MAYLIDSDVLIWHLRGHQPTVQLLRSLVRTSPQDKRVLPLGCSVISAFEVWAGWSATIILPGQRQLFFPFPDSSTNLPHRV